MRPHTNMLDKTYFLTLSLDKALFLTLTHTQQSYTTTLF